MKKTLLTFTFLFIYNWSYSQITTSDFYKEIKRFDLSTLINATKILTEDDGVIKIDSNEPAPFGFIGDDYQRFYIHFESAIQNIDNPYEYFVYGKTRVKDVICPFQGIFKIKEAKLYKLSDLTNYKQGLVVFEVCLYEDQKLASTGLIKGFMKSDFIINSKNEIFYDAINFIADGYSNNQFNGNWTSYKTNKTKKCNWGDFRIPESGDLDIGAGEFSPNSKYSDKGWKYLILFYSGKTEKDREIGKKQEEKKWWK